MVAVAPFRFVSVSGDGSWSHRVWRRCPPRTPPSGSPLPCRSGSCCRPSTVTTTAMALAGFGQRDPRPKGSPTPLPTAVPATVMPVAGIGRRRRDDQAAQRCCPPSPRRSSVAVVKGRRQHATPTASMRSNLRCCSLLPPSPCKKATRPVAPTRTWWLIVMSWCAPRS